MTDIHIKKTIEVYNHNAQEYHQQSLSRVPIAEREKFIKMIPTGGNILDLACGSGRDTEFFVKSGYRTVGIDMSFDLLSIASERVTAATFYQQDMRKLRFPENSFDGIWACAALLHLKKQELGPVLGSIRKILKPGGMTFLHVKVGTGQKLKAEPSLPGKSRFYAYYRPDEFNDYIRKADLTITETYTYNDRDRYHDSPETVWIVTYAKKLN